MEKTKKYKIAVLRQAYGPNLQELERPFFLSSEDRQDEFDTLADAQDAVEALDYCTTNGESGRPEYIIVDAEMEIGYDDWSDYNWDDNDCGEYAQCIEMMIYQDRDMVRRAHVTE